MDLLKELVRVIPTGKYNNITFYLKDIPIVKVEFNENHDVLIITNNMKDFGHYKLEFRGDVNDFVDKVNDVLTYGGVNQLIEKSKGSKITFNTGSLLNGEISEDSVIINQEEVDRDNTGEEDIIHKKYEINTNIDLSTLMLAEVISVFAFQYFV
jgi:hypothetical protein